MRACRLPSEGSNLEMKALWVYCLNNHFSPTIGSEACPSQVLSQHQGICSDEEQSTYLPYRDILTCLDDLEDLLEQSVKQGGVAPAEAGHFKAAQDLQEALLKDQWRPLLITCPWQHAFAQSLLLSSETSLWLKGSLIFSSPR